ncbi:MAG: hypothetical protein QOF51_2185 [Chloroflexota bacterium]|nr:hypothetical protein [Chloroflexota bacterium]
MDWTLVLLGAVVLIVLGAHAVSAMSLHSGRCTWCGYERGPALEALDPQQLGSLPLVALQCPACGWVEPVLVGSQEDGYWIL